MAVLTQGREVSTSLRRIPATALSADVCRPGRMCWPVPTRSALTISETGEHRASTPSRPNVRPREAFLEFKMGLLNYLARELQKVTHHNEIGGGEEGGEERWLVQLAAPDMASSHLSGLPDATRPNTFHTHPTASGLILHAVVWHLGFSFKSRHRNRCVVPLKWLAKKNKI